MFCYYESPSYNRYFVVGMCSISTEYQFSLHNPLSFVPQLIRFNLSKCLRTFVATSVAITFKLFMYHYFFVNIFYTFSPKYRLKSVFRDHCLFYRSLKYIYLYVSLFYIHLLLYLISRKTIGCSSCEALFSLKMYSRCDGAFC